MEEHSSMAFMAFLQVPPAEITVANHAKRNPRYPTQQAQSLNGFLYIQANHQAWEVVCNIGDIIHFYFSPNAISGRSSKGHDTHVHPISFQEINRS
jgi:hypothetical protein